MEIDCIEWSKEKSYIKNTEEIKKLRVINGYSERPVKLTGEYVNNLD